MADKYRKNHELKELLLIEDEESISVISPKQTLMSMSKKSSDVELQNVGTSMPISFMANKSKHIGSHKPKVRSQTYQGDIGKVNFFHQATLRHLSFNEREDSELTDIPFAPKIRGNISKYALDNVRNYELTKDRTSERQNFDAVDNEITHLESLKISLRGKKISSRGLLKWFTCIIIGVMTGMCMVFVTYTVGKAQTLLWYWYKIALKSGFGAGFGAFFTFSILMACVAGGAVLISPRAAGSGIPEVKAYLNGSSIPSLFYIKTLFAKLIGVIGAVAGSFMVGKEGPMVHSGAAIASGIGRAGIYCMPEKFSAKFLFGTDRDKRDLISCGAAAGVSAAFGAPIGGMLFALEEVSSFWRPGLNWRAFFCAATSNFTVLAVLACIQNVSCGSLQKTGLIDFVGHPAANIGAFDLVNFVCFIVLGVFGGLIGAAFNHINTALTKWRNDHTNKHWLKRFGEVILISIITISVIMIVPFAYNHCIKSPCSGTEDSDTCDKVVTYGEFVCDSGYYNPLASLLQPPRESIIEGLFYYQNNDSSNEWYPNTALWIAFICYFCVAVITYGINIPSGLFVPIILIGATFGHVMGKYFNDMLPKQHTFDVGTYALLGAAALLGGTTRMTISLTVILVEITDDVYYLLPIILTIMIAKWIGDRFNIPLYDAHIILKGVPFLEATLPKWFPTFIVAQDVMVTPVITLPRFCSMKRALHVLSNKEFSHSAFPIVIDNPIYDNNKNESDQDDDDYDDDDDDDDIDSHLLIKTSKDKELEREKKEQHQQQHTKQQPSRLTVERDEYHKYTSKDGTHHLWIGIILRSHIMAMLQNKCYAPKHDLQNVSRLTSLQLEKLAFFYEDRQLESIKEDIDIDKVLYQTKEQEQNGDYLDFTPYMNLSPFTVKENTPLLRIYTLFRSLGLRHLMVTNSENEIVGMITAKELEEHHLEHLIHHIIDRNSDNDDDKTAFASQRMAFLRGNDEYDEFDGFDAEFDLAFTERADNDKKHR